jgi:aminocarboxymuconate-semialdehyde decarboxylase
VESIDVHFHVTPPLFVEAVRRGAFAAVVDIARQDGGERWRFHPPPGVPVEPDIGVRADSSDDRLILQGLDARKLDAAAIGPPPEMFLYWADRAAGARIARTVNDGMAALVRAHPDRLFGLATLPLQDGDEAARELERAARELGLRGAEICTHVNGGDLDDPRLEPVWAAAERLRMPFFLHPQNSGDLSRLGDLHLWNLVGFPMETALAVARLILAGVLERHPGLKLILAHGGGYFPYQLGRLDHGYAVRPELKDRLPRRPSEYLESIYCDSLIHHEGSLRFLLDRVGDERVVLGSDYPYHMGNPAPVDTVRRLGLGRAREARVLGRNLGQLLGVM